MLNNIVLALQDTSEQAINEIDNIIQMIWNAATSKLADSNTTNIK